MGRTVLLATVWFFGMLIAFGQAPDDVFDRALSAIGLTKATGRMDMNAFDNFASGEFPLPFVRALLSDPYMATTYAQGLADAVRNDMERPSALLALAAIRTNERIFRGLGGIIADPLAEAKKKAEASDALAVAIADLHAFANAPLTEAQQARLRQATQAVPTSIAKAAALLLLASKQTLTLRRQAFSDAEKVLDLPAVFHRIQNLLDWNEWQERKWTNGYDPEVFRLMRLVDLKLLFAGGQELLMATEQNVQWLAEGKSFPKFSFVWDTPLGRIALGNAGNDTYRSDVHWLLVIDTGGDDTYFHAAATKDFAHPVSVVIDLDGNDAYLSERTEPSTGAGVLGYGVLVDMKGDDRYDGKGFAQGAGAFGIGVLWDRSGNDRYGAKAVCQGAAMFGAGISLDASGDDRYDCYIYAQGFGFTKGFGLLLDKDGNDVYIANDTDILFPSPQTKEHNASLAQGCGFGRRADYSDGHSLAGGIGVLMDLTGNDYYSAGVFGQGVGYWLGAGILWDGEGKDNYRCIWYGQGGSAHFAVGILIEKGGNDTYFATHHMAMGAGHDFSVGVLMDESGSDRYEAKGGLMLGAGNANGIGLFWDKAGNDFYRASGSPIFGGANWNDAPLRRNLLCLGIFLDTGGIDDYPTDFPKAGNKRLWTQGEVAKPLSEAPARGVGWDSE